MRFLIALRDFAILIAVLLTGISYLAAQPPRQPPRRPNGPPAQNGPQGPSGRADYWLPEGVIPIRAMIVGGVTNHRPKCLEDFCQRLGVGLVSPDQNMAAVAKATSHPEIESAWLVHTGVSAGALRATVTALVDPQRVLAIIPVHGAMLAKGNDDFNAYRGGNIPGDIKIVDAKELLSIPMLLTFDNGDGFVSPVTQEGFVRFGRKQGAPWAFATYGTGNHTNIDEALEKVILPWLEGVMKQRLPDPKSGQGGLKSLVESSGWLGELRTKSISSFATYKGDKDSANWFPDEDSAKAWKNAAIVPSYTIPDQAAKTPAGTIKDLKILDSRNSDLTSGVNWRICANFKQADQVCNNIRYFVAAPVPASIAGCDWIRPMQPGKDIPPYSADPIATFTMATDGDVFVALSERISPQPQWLSAWAQTKESLQISAGDFKSSMAMPIFKKHFAANQTVTLGANSQARGGALMYLTFVKPSK